MRKLCGVTLASLMVLSACRQYPAAVGPKDNIAGAVNTSALEAGGRKPLSVADDVPVQLDGNTPESSYQDTVDAVAAWLDEHPQIASYLSTITPPEGLSDDEYVEWAKGVAKTIPVEYSAAEEYKIQQMLAEYDYIVANQDNLEKDVANELGVNSAACEAQARKDEKKHEHPDNPGRALGHLKKDESVASPCDMYSESHVEGTEPGILTSSLTETPSQTFRTLAIVPSVAPSPTPIPTRSAPPIPNPFSPYYGLPGSSQQAPTDAQYRTFAQKNKILSPEYIPIVKQKKPDKITIDGTRCSIASWAFMAGSNYKWSSQKTQDYYYTLANKYFDTGFNQFGFWGATRFKFGVAPNDLLTWISGEYPRGTNFSFCTGSYKNPLSTLLFLVDYYYRPLVLVDADDAFWTSAHWCVPIGYTKDYIITNESEGPDNVRTSYVRRENFIRAWSMTRTRNEIYTICALLLFIPYLIDNKLQFTIASLENTIIDPLNVTRIKPSGWDYYARKGVALAALPTPQPTPTPTNAVSISAGNVLTDSSDDRVSATASQADGATDNHFQFTLNSPGGLTVEKIVLRDGQQTGGSDGWYSNSKSSYLGVALSGRALLNPTTSPVFGGGVVGLGSGPYKFDLYGADRGSLVPGNKLSLEVTTSRNGIRTVSRADIFVPGEHR